MSINGTLPNCYTGSLNQCLAGQVTLHVGYTAKKSSVLGIKNCIDIGDKTRASLVCHPNPDGNGWRNPLQTPPGQIRRRQGERAAAQRNGKELREGNSTGFCGGGTIHQVTKHSQHRPGSNRAAQIQQKKPLQELFTFAFFKNRWDVV